MRDHTEHSGGEPAAGPAGEAGRREIAVCIVTRRRPTQLRRLLEALRDLEAPPGIGCRFVVVDNDVEGSAAAVVEAARAGLPGPVLYVIEPHAGVSQARNTALRFARPAAFAAFIDDDETPSPGWLRHLHGHLVATGAAAACGPVRPVFERPVPAWLEATFELCYIRPKAGLQPSELHSCNLILDLRFLARAGLAFDPALGGQGGEDTSLGQAILAAGGTLAWADSAVVHEAIPAERARLSWLWRRWMRYGGTEAALAAKSRAAWRSLAAGGARIVLGGLGLIAALPLLALGRAEPAVRRLYTVARGIGMLMAVCGHVRHDYGGAAR